MVALILAVPCVVLEVTLKRINFWVRILLWMLKVPSIFLINGMVFTAFFVNREKFIVYIIVYLLLISAQLFLLFRFEGIRIKNILINSILIVTPMAFSLIAMLISVFTGEFWNN